MMRKNPYKFTGPLDPVQDQLVCIRRQKEIDKVITGIRQGEYWTILGPRQIGKTTLLRQLENEISVFRCIYIDLEVTPKNDEAFYEWIIDTITERIPADLPMDRMEKWKNFGPELNFYYFLKNFRPKENKRIILFIDEIEKAPSIRSFLHIWRKVFHERAGYPELERYTIIITGGVDLVTLTVGPTSPFNIASKLYLTDFSEAESKHLIEEPVKNLGFHFNIEATEELIEQTSGHPQILQHLCHILVDRAIEKKKEVGKDDVLEAIEKLFIENSNLKALNTEVKTNKVIEELVKKLLKGEPIKYYPYQELSTTGTGPIVPLDKYCAIRNNIYKELLMKLIDFDPDEQDHEDDLEYITKICTNESPPDFCSIEYEKRFLKSFFRSENIEIDIMKNDTKLGKIDVEGKEKLILLYLAYKNYKALTKGFSHWKKIPLIWEYRLSNKLENNRCQKPEWDLLNQAFNEKGIKVDDDDIKIWIFSIRKNLEKINATDIIHSVKGRGKGYLLKGTVNFSPLK